ncbi:MAG: dethiobiotin synthase [Nitrospirae bacterium]|nr:dethiobiotin synthase [Nitrospirota bacterium]
MKGFFITGTDTGVGKTVVTALLGILLRNEGHRITVLKPIETGCTSRESYRENSLEGDLVPEDGAFLKSVLGLDQELDDITPFRFSLPLAPLAISQLSGKAINVESLRSILRSAINKCHDAVSTVAGEILLIEGIGGLMVPITERYFVYHMIEDSGLPAILVAGNKLGAINHTLLSIEFLSKRGIKTAGIIINNASPDNNDPSKETNPGIIERLSPVPVIGTVPFLPSVDINSMSAISKVLKYDIICRSL